jgi:hypothetical protein
MTNVHQQCLAEKLEVSFVNLEEKYDMEDLLHNTKLKELVLRPVGQVLHPGAGPAKTTIFTRYQNNHFDLLEPCQENDADVSHVWDLQAEATYFRLKRVPKDHACGWTCIARGLNQAKVPVPLDLQKPAPSDE